MKKQGNSYAKERIGFYQSRFLSQTNQQLVNDFNQLGATKSFDFLIRHFENSFQAF